jgi:hypothetical protein
MSPVSDTRRLRGRRKRLSADSLQSRNSQEGACMLDIVMIAIALGFFALSVGYTIACDRL